MVNISSIKFLFQFLEFIEKSLCIMNDLFI